MAGRAGSALIAAAFMAASGAACGRSEPSGPVRTPLEASEIAQRALRAAHLDEQVVDARRQGDAWVVITRWPQTSTNGHLVTVDRETGAVRMERYRTVELGSRERVR